MAEGLLCHDDPRLSLPVQPIAPTAPAAAMMVATLANLLRSRDEGALAAPAAGFAHDLMVIKSHGATQAVFDPVLVRAGGLRRICDETGALTGDLIRATLRADSLSVTGNGSDGKPVTFSAGGALAIEVQQALDLLRGHAPVRTLGAYQRAVIDRRGAPSRINAALAALMREATAGTAPEAVATDWPFLLLGRLGRIDLRDPGRPAGQVAAALLALSAMISAPARVLVDGGGMFGLVPALVARWPRAALHLRGPEPLMAELIERVGAPQIVLAPAADPPRYGLILANASDEDEGAGDGPRAWSRALLHPGGLALIGAEARDAELEQRLKQAFIEVYCGVTPGAVVYAALRSEMDIGRALAGLMACGAGQGDQDWPSGGLLHLGKDGQDRPVPF